MAMSKQAAESLKYVPDEEFQGMLEIVSTVQQLANNLSQGTRDFTSGEMTATRDHLRKLCNGPSNVTNGDEGKDFDINGIRASSDIFNGIQPSNISDGETPKAIGRPKFIRLKASYESKRSRPKEQAKSSTEPSKRRAKDTEPRPSTNAHPLVNSGARAGAQSANAGQKNVRWTEPKTTYNYAPREQ